MTNQEGADEALGTQSRKYLVFHLGGASYGLGVLRVREIVDPPDLRPSPRTFDHLAGLVTIRGKAIPVLNLRRRYGLPAPERKEGAHRCVVVVQVRLSNGTRPLLGLLFDRPGGIAAVRGDEIQPEAPPPPGTPDEGVIGIAPRPDGPLALLSPDRLGNDPGIAAMLRELG